MPKLYKRSLTLTEADYKLIVEQATGKKSALEFGPGFTTYALIEAGVERIVSLESAPDWLENKRKEFQDYPQVSLGRYWDENPVKVEGHPLDGFDIALVDAPTGMMAWHAIGMGREPRKVHPAFPDCSRFNTCLFALQVAPIVLLHDAWRPLERGTLGRLDAMGHSAQFLSREIARITRDGKNKGRPYLQGSEELGRPTAGPEPGH